MADKISFWRELSGDTPNPVLIKLQICLARFKSARDR